MQQPTEPELAQMTLQMLQRVQLQGGEVDAFVACRAWLMSKVNGAPATIPQPPVDMHEGPSISDKVS